MPFRSNSLDAFRARQALSARQLNKVVHVANRAMQSPASFASSDQDVQRKSTGWHYAIIRGEVSSVNVSTGLIAIDSIVALEEFCSDPRATNDVADTVDVFDPHLSSGNAPSIDSEIWAIYARGTTATDYPVDEKTVTADHTTDTLNSVAHGLENGTPVSITSTGSMPAGLTSGTIYYVLNKTDDTFQLGNGANADAIDFTTSGSGTLTAQVYANADWLRIPIALDTTAIFKLPTGDYVPARAALVPGEKTGLDKYELMDNMGTIELDQVVGVTDTVYNLSDIAIHATGRDLYLTCIRESGGYWSITGSIDVGTLEDYKDATTGHIVYCSGSPAKWYSGAPILSLDVSESPSGTFNVSSNTACDVDVSEYSFEAAPCELQTEEITYVTDVDCVDDEIVYDYETKTFVTCVP